MALIFLISSVPSWDLPRTRIPHLDKIAHVAEYLILQLLLMRAFLGSFPKIRLAKIVILAIIISSLYALSDEWHQRYTPGRICDIYDFTADIVGVNIGVLIYRMRGSKWLM